MLRMKEEPKKRIYRLAKLYGPFVRFYPDGTEGDGKTSLEKAAKDDEAAAKTPDEQAAIDKARLNEQQLEQERSNARRANEAAQAAEERIETAESEKAALEEQLAAAQAKAAEAGIENVELDITKYQTTDIPLVRKIQVLEKKIDAKDERLSSLEKTVTDYKEQLRKDEAVDARNAAYEELLTDLDAEYGVENRNAAVKKWNELCAAGEVPKGKPTKATRVMERCYKEAKAAALKTKEADAKKKGSSLNLDTGSGGGTAPNLSGVEIPSGLSLDEAVDQIAGAKAS